MMALGVAAAVDPSGASTRTVRLRLQGGGGATYNRNDAVANPGSGGGGGYIDVSYELAIGTVLKLRVGQGGQYAATSNVSGGGGGGLTGVCIGSWSHANALAVAPGGGGSSYNNGYGGPGGTTSGSIGGGTGPGGVGTQSAGGAAGGGAASAGSAFAGGEGSNAAAVSNIAPGGYVGGGNGNEGSGGGGGGGGGSGYYGGGGGAEGGGGGGGANYALNDYDRSITEQVAGAASPSTTYLSGASQSASSADFTGIGDGGIGYADDSGQTAPNHGENGRAIISIDGSPTTYDYTGSEVSITIT